MALCVVLAEPFLLNILDSMCECYKKDLNLISIYVWCDCLYIIFLFTLSVKIEINIKNI